METTRTHTPVLPYASACKHLSPCANVYAGRACALDATKANGYDAQGRATVTYLEADEDQGVAAGSVVYATDPYTGRPSGQKYGDPIPTPDVAGAYLESHAYDSFPKPVPFWIVRCNHPSHGPIALNAGHHYREESKHHAELLIIRHDADEHPTR